MVKIRKMCVPTNIESGRGIPGQTSGRVATLIKSFEALFERVGPP